MQECRSAVLSVSALTFELTAITGCTGYQYQLSLLYSRIRIVTRITIPCYRDRLTASCLSSGSATPVCTVH